MDWEFKNFLSVVFLENLARGPPYFDFSEFVGSVWKVLKILWKKNVSFDFPKICFLLCWLKYTTHWVVAECLGTPGAVGFFENFLSVWILGKFGQGFALFLKFWVFLFANFERRGMARLDRYTDNSMSILNNKNERNKINKIRKIRKIRKIIKISLVIVFEN